MSSNNQANRQYSVAKLAALAGISVRTLHLYDRIGLLRPAGRSDAGYRYYAEPELLRLQQILFYKELGLNLAGIATILDDPDFDLVNALESHRQALVKKQAQLQTLISTVEKTIIHLKEKNMPAHEELYEGLSKEEALAWRNEAVARYGLNAVAQSEQSLRQRGRADLEALKAEQKSIAARLSGLQAEDPESDAVQEIIALHYANIRKFWGTFGDPDPQAAAYAGLADLYMNDERFLQTEGKARPEFAAFMKAAMRYFAAHL